MFFYGTRKIYIIWFAKILQYWKIENVDNFDITTHVNCFRIVGTKY